MAGGGGEHLPLSFTAKAVDPLVLVERGRQRAARGRPGGDSLKMALRARVGVGTQPAADQQVAFEIQSRMLDSAALDELGGGSLHASVNVVQASNPGRPVPGRSGRWSPPTPGGGPQVQWILGTEVGLPVQRVTATLLDTTATRPASC